MSYIPNVRDPYEPVFTGKTPKRPNAYYEGNLKEEDKQKISYYDDAAEETNNFFNNLDVYAEQFEGTLDLNKIDCDKLLDENFDLDALSEEEREEISKETQIAVRFRDCLLHWLEMHRNEVVVSIMDSYPFEDDVKKSD